jgi:hypothetical protein
MKTRLALALCVGVPVIAAVSPAHADKVNITIKNSSDWTLEELYLSPSKQEDWGPDQLAEKVVKPGESFTLTGVPGGRAMDLKVVDEDGDECVVGKEKFAANTTYTITSQDLLDCQEATEAADDEDA